MKLVALLDPNAPVSQQLAWILRFARAEDDDVLLLLQGNRAGKSEEGSPERVAIRVRGIVEKTAGFRFHTEAPDDAEPDGEKSIHSVRIETQDSVEAIAKRVAEHNSNLLLVLLGTADPRDGRANAIGKEVLHRVTCRVAVLRLGPEAPPDQFDILVPAARGPHTRAALRLARDLARTCGGAVKAVYVEPRIGADAELVGRRALDRSLAQAFGSDRDGVEPIIVVDDDFERGLRSACETRHCGMVLIGTWLGSLGPRFLGTPGGRLIRKRPELPVVALREAIPFTNRLRRIVEKVLQSAVPQLARESRVDLAERVQSNSAWNFDFVALISLSTLIAAMGLLQDSAAVVIGAMLVAPLMTPILGVGLALAQANAALARRTFRTVGLGVVTAFLLALFVGLVDSGFDAPTEEMLRRGWPGVLDLFVAFVSGLAAAYATSRSNLFAALPGVAIAAALVPPIATSGLATAIGDVELAYGSFLLFVTNMVAIVMASSFSLWAVGVRSVKSASRWTWVVGAILVALTVALTLHLATRSPQRVRVERIPQACREAMREAAAPSYNLRDVRLVGEEGTQELAVRIGGAAEPPADLAAALRDAAAPHFAGPVRVRMTFEWEAVAEPPDTER